MYTLCAIDKRNEQFFVEEVFFRKNARVIVDKKDQDVFLIILGKGHVQCISVALTFAGKQILPVWALRECVEIYFAFFQDQIFKPLRQKAS